MSLSKPMSEKLKKQLAHAMENGLKLESDSGQIHCLEVQDTEEGTLFTMKFDIHRKILIPDR